MNIKKNDTVLVIAGNYKGKIGKVLKVLREKERVLVEGVNIVKKHVRKSPKYPQGGIIEMEAPIHVSNVMLVCPKCGKATRVGHTTLVSADGKRSKMRVCKKCGEMF
ncbi:MAG: 50S ribosomal protein L24 [Candidatus Kryptonium sp.]|nr:50S ribosomal protein L24 [Candidatus Kryptonium sp.]MCX7762710.1 50S ribosomal protein L24 [Candidatus Kryptonium sp.]MDW8108195.1 50S ribosomal protein L24 [Candidatus Kryptonium sp.]